MPVISSIFYLHILYMVQWYHTGHCTRTEKPLFHSMFEAMFEYGGVKVMLKKIYAQNTCIHTLTERNSL